MGSFCYFIKKRKMSNESLFRKCQKKAPLIHNITNFVTVNDCATVILACGGSPIVSDVENEAEEIMSICGGLCINTGTLNDRTMPRFFSG